MHESFWGTFIIAAGVIIIGLIFFMQRVVNSEEELYILLKETTEAAMMDAVDYKSYYSDSDNGQKVVRMDREAFVESFVRRFAQNASLSDTYKIDFYDINEYPPKVSIRVSSKQGGTAMNENFEFKLTDKIDAIIEVAN